MSHFVSVFKSRKQKRPTQMQGASREKPSRPRAARQVLQRTSLQAKSLKRAALEEEVWMSPSNWFLDNNKQNDLFKHRGIKGDALEAKSFKRQGLQRPVLSSMPPNDCTSQCNRRHLRMPESFSYCWVKGRDSGIMCLFPVPNPPSQKLKGRIPQG